MALDPRYMTDTSLEEYFVDKSTGEPLAGGFVYFYEDDARTVPKLVYELSGAPPNYTYSPLPNPIQLSAVGTPQDAAGNNIAIYYYPFDAAGNLQLYYVAIFNSGLVPQFTREAWPNEAIEDVNPIAGSLGNFVNFIDNPQFAFTNFAPATSLTISSGGAGTQTVNFAPGWSITVVFSGAGSVILTQTSIAGITAYPSNPPYTLTVTPGINITGITVTQRLLHNPDIWSPQNAASLNGWVATSILLAPATSLHINYAPSAAAFQTILTANNLSGVYTEFKNTVQLMPPTNTDLSTVGYVDFDIILSPVNASTFSNVQIVQLERNLPNIPYEQEPVNRQLSNLSWYYNNIIQAGARGQTSYLVGWDFPLNPTQPLGPTIAAFASGANTSNYFWDQTIIFQSANSGIASSRGTNGCLTLTATNTTQCALVQYLEQSVARMILNGRNSVNVAAFTNQVGGLQATVSLWYTTDGALPSAGAGNSIVATLNADGSVATRNGTWTQVPRSGLGNATFTIGASPTTTTFNDYGFSGWDLAGIPATNTATFFAIVVGTASLTAANVVNFDSISLVPGEIPTRPAPETGGIALYRCQRYYEMSFETGLVPGTQIFGGAISVCAPVLGRNLPAPFTYLNEKVTLPVVTLYNPVNNNNQMYDISTGVTADCTFTSINYESKKDFSAQYIPPVTGVAGDHIVYQFTADSRLGV